jgi:hypothetical protein
MANTEDPELVGEAGYRVGEILHERGDPAAARPALQKAVATGDATFAPRAAALLASL